MARNSEKGEEKYNGKWCFLVGVMIGSCVGIFSLNSLPKETHVQLLPKSWSQRFRIASERKFPSERRNKTSVGRIISRNQGKIPEKFKDQPIKLPIKKVPKSAARAVYRPEIPRKSWEYVGNKGGTKDELVIPNALEVHFMSLEDSGALYHKYLNSIQVLCRKVERMGSLTDGGWDICMDQPYRLQKPCLVYSFGIGNDFTFDEAVAEVYGCDVHSFDPGLGRGDYKHKNLVSFHAIGLYKRSGRVVKNQYGKILRWPVKRFKDVVSSLGHNNRTVDIVKMDIEHDEWDALPDMCEQNDLSKVGQLQVEFHSFDGYHQETGDLYTSRLKVLRCLYDAGFRIFLSRRNLGCSRISSLTNRIRIGCMEVSFINTKHPQKKG